jgi:hypothetical protein
VPRSISAEVLIRLAIERISWSRQLKPAWMARQL